MLPLQVKRSEICVLQRDLLSEICRLRSGLRPLRPFTNGSGELPCRQSIIWSSWQIFFSAGSMILSSLKRSDVHISGVRMPMETYLTGNQAAGSVRLMGSIPMHTVSINGRLQGQTKVHKGVLTDTGHYGRLVLDKGSAWPAFALFAYPSGTSFFSMQQRNTTKTGTFKAPERGRICSSFPSGRQ